MRSGIFVISIVVALDACMTAAERPAQVSPGDILIVASEGPNVPVPPAGEDPNKTWDPVEHLAPGWQSMALTTRYYNPEDPASADKTPRRSLSFAGRIDVIDPNGLIGLSEVATDALALDVAGSELEVVRVSQSPPSYKPLKYSSTWRVDLGQRTASVVPYEFSIGMSMAPGAPFPVMLSRLEWSMAALLSDAFEAVDIPFAATDDWIELVLGLEVLVEEATVSEGRYRYRMKARYERSKISYLDARDRPSGFFIGRASDYPYSWPSDAFPEMIVTAIDVVDAEGNSVWGGSGSMGTGGGFDDSRDQRIVTRDGVGFCSTCGKAAFIRHVIAFEPYHRELQFVLENVLVPGF